MIDSALETICVHLRGFVAKDAENVSPRTLAAKSGDAVTAFMRLSVQCVGLPKVSLVLMKQSSHDHIHRLGLGLYT